ncbi:MAG TPA: LysM peptidoglycan-binding domain-containing protein [Phycisphaerae bacterium]|nr:LysM peptidoglycan-binding domain-containing protein [Phycisphaerae bacterium]
MLCKLGSYQFDPLPDGIDLEGAHKMAHLEIPDFDDVLQDFGPGPFTFTITGIIRASAGGLESAIGELDAVRRDGNGPWLLSIGQLSWPVLVAAPHYTRLRNGHCRYTVQCVQYAAPSDFVYIKAPELAAPDRMDYWLAQAIARAKAFNLQGAIGKLYNRLSDIEAYVSRIRNNIVGIESLAQMPAGLIARLRADLSLTQLMAEKALVTALAIINPGSDFATTTSSVALSPVQDAAAAIYQYVQLLHTEAGLMSQRAGALPIKDQTYIVCGQDTLQSISLKFYGTMNRWQDIAVTNRVWDPSALEAGDVLVIPE